MSCRLTSIGCKPRKHFYAIVFTSGLFGQCYCINLYKSLNEPRYTDIRFKRKRREEDKLTVGFRLTVKTSNAGVGT